MKIQELYVQSFGVLRERFFRFDEGVNILEGPNESGKSTLAAFIKYLFYGPGAKNSPDRIRYMTGVKSGGWVLFTAGNGTVWRVERVTVIESDGTRESVRDNVRIVDVETNREIPEKHPGEYFFGVDENVFMNTAYIGQMNAVRPDGNSLSGAVENLLQAADENVNLKKAGDRLNQARRDLLPKNSAGGKIREKEEEKARLTEALAAATERSAKVLEVQSALENASRKRQELEEKKDQVEELCDAAETVSLCKKLAAAEETAGKLKSYQNALNVLSAPPFSDLQDKLDAIKGRAKKEDLSETGSHLKIHNEEAAAALEDGEYLESKARLFLAVSITMAIAGLIALAAGAIMVYFGFPTGQFVVPFCVMALFIVVGIVFYVLQGKNLNLLQDILDEWSVDSLDELDELAEAGDTGRQNPEAESAGMSAAAVAQINTLAAACGVEADEDPEVTLEMLQKKADKAAADLETVRSKVENLSGRLSALKEAAEGIDRGELIARYKKIAPTPAGKAAMQLDAAGLARLQKERDFALNAWRAQAKKEADLEQAMALLGAQEGPSPDILAGQLERVEEEIAELTKQHEAYALAQEALQNASQSLRTTLIPTITEKASAMMEAATGGKYGSIRMDPSFGLRFETADGSDSVDLLSKGTADLAYVSLRLALAQSLFGENGREVPPMIMDETFAAVDCERLALALHAMKNAGLQCILCTCRGDEGRIGRELGCAVTQIA